MGRGFFMPLFDRLAEVPDTSGKSIFSNLVREGIDIIIAREQESGK
jgi:hypothetical protein